MSLSRTLAASGVAFAFVAVAACSSSSGNPGHATPTASGATATVPARPATSPSAGPSFVSGGSALANTDNLIYVLKAVNPKIGTDKGELITKSKALCTHIDANESESQLEAAAASEFTNGSWVPSELEAQAIVGTVQAYGGC